MKSIVTSLAIALLWRTKGSPYLLAEVFCLALESGPTAFRWFHPTGSWRPNSNGELIWGLAPTCPFHSEDQSFCLCLNISETFWVDDPGSYLSNGVRFILSLSNSTHKKTAVGLDLYPLSIEKRYLRISALASDSL